MGTNVNTDLKKSKRGSEQQVEHLAVNLADDMVGLLGYAQPMVELLFEQMGALDLAQTPEQRTRISSGVLAMLDSLGRYMQDMRALCEKVREDDQ